MAHIHSVYDTDAHFRIDAATRTMKYDSSAKPTLVQFDHNSERITFEMPRYIDGHDMSLCNKVEIHYLNFSAAEKASGVYAVDDLQVSPADDSVVIGSWLVSRNATGIAGSLNFVIRFACFTGDVIDYAWHTEIYSEIVVGKGINNGEAIVEDYVDVLEAWKQEIFAEFQVNFDTEREAQIAAIEAKGAEVLASIPADYTNMARQISRNDKRITNLEKGLMADAFETDASVAYVKDVPANALPYAAVTKVGGMTYRDGDTLKNAKVTEIESVGANIIPFPFYLTGTREISGVTFTVNDNQSITLNGTVSASNGVPIGTIDGTKLSPGSYYASLETNLPSGCTFYSSSTGTSTFTWIPSGGKNNVVTIPQGSWMLSNTAFQVRLWIEKGATFNNVTIYPFIAKSDVAVPYAPYVKHTLPIPEAVRPAHGINENAYDYIEWCEDGTRKSYKRVDKIVLNGSEAWSKSTASNIFQAGCPLSKIAGNTKTIRAIVSNGYGFLDWYNPDASIKPYFRIVPDSDILWIEATVEQFADLDAWKAYLAANPVEIVYPLAEPIVTDISDILTADNMLPVEGGGTITAVNENAFAVPTEITYQMKGVAE